MVTPTKIHPIVWCSSAAVVPQVLRRGFCEKNASFFLGFTMMLVFFGGLQNEQISAELEMILWFFLQKLWTLVEKMMFY